jgi:hypothetical protein
MMKYMGGETIEGGRPIGSLSSRGPGTSFHPEDIRDGSHSIDTTDKSINTNFLQEETDPDHLIQTLISSSPSIYNPMNNYIHIITHTIDGKDLLMILDIGTSVNMITEDILKDDGFPLIPSSDIILESIDDMNITPMGIYRDYKFSIEEIIFIIRIYIMKKISFQLLLGNEFLWKIDIILFPYWGAFIIILPIFMIINTIYHQIDIRDISISLYE